ncbi:MAG: membrane protein insertion efficiency factor YidD [Pseudomonadota bacterium]
MKKKIQFKPSVLGHVFIGLIKLYKVTLSPFIGWGCKFQPTCSSYGLEAFQTRNVFIAIYLTTVRVLRCNPFSSGGYDPVPTCEHQHKDS